MNNTNGQYRNPRHEEIAELLRGGFSDKAVARLLGVDRKAVARVRKAEGIAPHSASLSAESQWTQHTGVVEGGHTRWTGTTDNRGMPIMRIDGRYVPAARFAFETFRDREPNGYVKAGCGAEHCLTASHLMDETDRRNQALQLRAMQGLAAPWTECCKCGADWNTAGRIDPDLKLYCNDCKTRRGRERKAS